MPGRTSFGDRSNVFFVGDGFDSNKPAGIQREDTSPSGRVPLHGLEDPEYEANWKDPPC